MYDNKEILYHYTSSSSLFISLSLSFSLVLFTKKSFIIVKFETVKQTKKKVKKSCDTKQCIKTESELIRKKGMKK